MTLAEQLAAEIEETIREIERELHDHRLDLSERIAIGFALERFADRVPHERRVEPW